MEYEAQILPDWGKEQQGILFKDEMSSLQVGDKRDAKRKGRARDPRRSPGISAEKFMDLQKATVYNVSSFSTAQ
jgi:hypothetical protein